MAPRARRSSRQALPSRLKVLDVLSTGGMGELLIATRTLSQGSEQRVVIKRIRPEYAADAHYRRMFEEEVRNAALVSHPNVAQVLDVVSIDGSLMLMMEYLEGITLSTLLSWHAAHEHVPSFPVVATIVVHVCEALHAMHDKGRQHRGAPLVHRDVAPTNIIITRDGCVKLIDFGVAKDLARHGETVAGQVKGKYGYMAPEQLLGQAIDERVDVYGLGVVMYELLTARRLFPSDLAAQDMLPARRAPTLGALRSLRAGLPARVDAVLERALAYDAQDRFDGQRALSRALLALQPGCLVPPVVLADLVALCEGATCADGSAPARRRRAPSVIEQSWQGGEWDAEIVEETTLDDEPGVPDDDDEEDTVELAVRRSAATPAPL